MTGWTVGGTGGAVGLQNGVVDGVSPVDGAQHIAFNGGDTSPGSTIFQTFTTVVGQEYLVSFNVGRKGSGGGALSLLAEVESSMGAVLATKTTTAPTSPGYGALQNLSFVATTTNSTLTFKDTSTATVGVDLLLDNTLVHPVYPVVVTAFTNGSFELPALVSGGNQNLVQGSTAMVGWTVGGTGGAVGLQNGAVNGVSAVDGTQHIAFNGGDTSPGSTVFQTFATTVGRNYVVSFNAGRKGSGGGTLGLLAEIDSGAGEKLASKTADVPISPGYGPLQDFSFVATTTNSTLTFTDTSAVTASVDLLLDNVSVTAIPECVRQPNGLTSWWRAEGGAVDQKGTYPGITVGGLLFSDGLVGQAFTFNGVDSQVTFGNEVGNFDTNDFTIEFWIRTTSTRLESVMEKWPLCGVSSMWNIRIGGMGATGHLGTEMFSDTSGSDHTVLNSGRPINDGLFHHVALVRSGTNVAYYVDGAFDVSSSSSGGVTRINNTANFSVGNSVCVGHDGTSPFTGQMDEISVFNRALSQAEIESIYDAGSAGKCLSIKPRGLPVAYWKFDEGSGAVAHDSLGRYDGSLSTTGASLVSTGISGGALSVTKTNNGFVTMGHVLDFTNGNFSLVAWIKTPAGDTTECSSFLTKQESGWPNGYDLAINACVQYSQSGKVWFGDSPLPGQEVTSTTSVNDGNWHQVVAVYEQGGTKFIYVDGAPAEASKASLSIVTNNAYFVVGGITLNGNPAGQFTGLVDDVQVYDYALQSDEADFLFHHPGETIMAAACVSPPTGLVGWWQGEGAAGDQLRANPGTASGGLAFTNGLVGQAFDFNGTDSQVNFGNSVGNFDTNDFTVDFWIRTTATGHESLMEKRVDCSISSYWSVRIRGAGAWGPAGRLEAEISSDSGGGNLNSIFGSRAINDGVFHHVALQRQGTNLALYVDGTLDVAGSSSGVTRINNSAPMTVGKSVCVGSDGTVPLAGQVDEISVYNRALSPQEIAAVFNAGSAGKCFEAPAPCVLSPSGLVSWWPAEGDANEISGGNNGVLRGDATYAAGRVGQAFSFDGNGDGVLVGNPGSLHLQNFTIEGWIKRGSATQISASSIYGEIVGYGAGGYVLGFLSDGRLFLSKNGVSSVQSSRFIADTNWHHVAVSKSGSSVVFYVDGASEAALTYNITFDFSTSLVIGAVNDTLDASFLGLIDELSIYNRALSAGEIQSIYDADSAGKCPLVPISIGPSGGFFTNTINVTISGPPTNVVVYYTLDGTTPSTNSHVYSEPIVLTNTATVTAQGFTNGLPITQVACSAYRFWEQAVSCVAPPGAISWWTADCTLQDVLGLNPGAPAGAVTFEPGLISQAFGFGREGDAVTVANSPSLQLQNFTIETWVKRKSPAQATPGPLGNGTLFSYGYSGYAFGIFNDGRLLLGKVGVDAVASTMAVTNTDWHHVAVTKSGTNVAFYVDGISAGIVVYNTTFTFSSNPAIGATGTLLLASFYGLIDELAVYGRPLTTNEIQALYNAGAGGKCPTFPPIIITPPVNRTVPVGGSTSFSVTAGGSPPLNYQWSFNGTPIPNATNAMLGLTGISSTNTGTYTVTVSNAFEPAANASAALAVTVPPAITQQPKSQTVLIGSTATFTVGYTGSTPLTFQWRRNGLLVPGGSSPTLVINNVQSTNAGTYTVRISNSLNFALSDPATLTVASGQFTALTVGTNGVQLNVQGETGGNYILEMSTDFKQWDPLATLLNNPATWQFIDTTAPGVAYRFYRLRKSP